jgi:hypothetical protein
MKKAALGLTAALLLAGAGYAAQAGKTYTGEIMDGACAMSGSHAAMMKNDPTMKTAKACTDGCVAHGSKYVLYNAATKTTYDLDDQAKPKEFSGEKVRVTGTLDATTKTIHVADIKKG